MRPRYHGHGCARNYPVAGPSIRTRSQADHLVDDPDAIAGVVVGLVADARVDPPLGRRVPLEEGRRGGRHQRVVSAVHDEHGQREAVGRHEARVDAVHRLEEQVAEARGGLRHGQRVRVRHHRRRRVAGDLGRVPGVRQGEGRPDAGEEAGEAAEERAAAAERRRRQDRHVRLGAVGEEVVGHDQSAERVPVDRRGEAVDPARVKAILDVVEEVVPLVDVGAPASRGAEAAMVERGGGQPRRGEPPPRRVVAPGVIAPHPVDDEDRAPRIAGRRPPPSQERRAVAGGDGLHA